MKKVAIITLNYNDKEDTLELLVSLSKLQTTNPDLDKVGSRIHDGEYHRDCQLLTVVVDNASSDGSVPAIRKQFPGVDILQTGANLGFSGGYNRGLEYAKIWGADYFLLINNDCLIKDSNLIPELVKILKENPRAGLVSPKIYFAPGFEFHKDRYQEEDLGKVIWFAGGKFDWDNIGNLHRGINEVDKGQYDKVEEAEIFSGACFLIKREVLEVGGLDEKYFLYFEDSDFAKRAKEAGFKIYYNGQAAIFHKVSQSTGIGSEITDYYHTRNRLIFGMRYGKTRTKLALLKEALKLLILGRPAQRKGILDFYLGIVGGVGDFGKDKEKVEPEYPLKLSIGIVNYNTADLTKKLLESIFKKDSGFDPEIMEVIVLDNGLIDPCKDKIKEFLPRIKYLQNNQNEGFSKGYNKTIKFSLGEYYLMLNSDIEVLEGGLLQLVKTEDDLRGNAVLGGKLVFPDLSSQDSAFHLPTLKGAFKEYFLSQEGSYFMYQPSGEKPKRVEGLVMACLMIPKKVLKKVGLLDEGTFIFFEDIEYARRLKEFKIPMYFVPAAKFIHHHGASTKRIGQQKAYQRLKEASRYYHGKIYYTLLSSVLFLGQKFGRVKTPLSRWTKETT